MSNTVEGAGALKQDRDYDYDYDFFTPTEVTCAHIDIGLSLQF
jgi:hypothetical protein